MKPAWVLGLLVFVGVGCKVEPLPSQDEPGGSHAAADGGPPASGPAGAGGRAGAAGTAGAGGAAGAGGDGCREPDAATGVTLNPELTDVYRAFSLGSVPGVPPQRYGGLTLAMGDPSTLLIGGNANDPGAQLYAIRVVRACGHIVGFEGTAMPVAQTAHIDGGVDYGPGGVFFFAGYPTNTIGQIRPGESVSARTVDLGALGVPASVGALKFVPARFARAGALKVVSWPGGQWFELAGQADAMGLLDITAATPRMGVVLTGGPEGFAYIPPGSPHFERPSLIVSEWSAGGVATYDLDAQGDPVISTRKAFLTGLMGAEGAFFDPATGDFLFSTWNGTGGSERVILVQGFVPIG